ncbi:tRNA cyclic N6-threonylcarbamoyladenosine(37) synthase TcdA [Zoogloea sp.]|uniref:tRNA cyclic N6-threonylcarbamoyladenosine(37) synthase TcdA n=1 Tax=Zoogloea sp. TaxID=49181 RepID=UPI00262E09A1|nr:tRNA cyclic N6-threonylcarbamoyladenosine(37) synthase TcdA [Zoogloea sp.]MDD3352505.1 tRNA cyclic N6-threonylcarbamoyladenosine(37) synthase TcdA [Zoogloea sp.]
MESPVPNSPDDARRFGGIARLYGAAGRARLAQAHVCVVGIGGVGAWAAEALARSGVGRLTLIDLDHVAESNINRQIHAADATLGQAKVEAMRERIAGYSPGCVVTVVDDFVTVDNAARLLGGGFDYVIDAIDAVRVKVAMIAVCHGLEVPVVTCGAAGGQIDPTRIQVADLARTIQDPLLAKVRGQLRKSHAFPRDPKKKFGVEAVFSSEPLRYPAPEGACEAGAGGPAGLNCAGFGSVVTVTACVGLFAAARVLNGLSAGPAPDPVSGA